MVEFALVLPMLLVLFLGITDFGRVFQSGIVIEAAARDAAEIVAEEYRRNPPGGIPMLDPAPPGVDAYYQPLHDLGARTACREARLLPNTTYVPDDPATLAIDEEACIDSVDPAASMPLILVCIHDNEDTLCDEPAFGATIPPECSDLLDPMTPMMEGGTETSRYVEVRICYRFTTLFNFPLLSLDDVWLQKDRAFTVAYYPPPPTPEPPPPPPPPDPTVLPTPEPTPTPTPTPEETPTPTPEPTPEPTPTPPEPTPTPPEPTPTPPEPTPASEPT
jgi:cell division septation protein DedD